MKKEFACPAERLTDYNSWADVLNIRGDVCVKWTAPGYFPFSWKLISYILNPIREKSMDLLLSIPEAQRENKFTTKSDVWYEVEYLTNSH